jgi:UDP-4-amino-4,6-dideoxy-N-acetyl-beta-L-altrosamine transaminase
MNIPYGKQHINDDDIQAVVETLKSDYLTQGPKIAEFETAFAKYIGAEYAVAVANGTAALHLSAIALNIQKDHRVITTPITFSATANCIRYCGGEVVFSDIDPETYLLDIEKVKKLLESSPPGTYKGIIPVDFGGYPVNMEIYRKLADEYGLWIIEDACHAPGAYFYDSKGIKQSCGNSIYADLAIFSFHPVKHIAAGEGGMITTNSKVLYKKLLALRSHGIIRDQNAFKNDLSLAIGSDETSANYPGWYMEMQELGYNYRLTDFQAALGLSQLKRADRGIEKRKAIAYKYDRAFINSEILSQEIELSVNKFLHAYHLYIIKVNNRLGLYDYLRTHNIFTQVHYIPTHLMPYYQKLGSKKGDFPMAEDYYSKCLSLPIYPTLSDTEQDFVIKKIFEYYNI